ncbi:MAG: hypothetical protein Q9227_008115 [Pyrenula ochraceoflavens]
MRGARWMARSALSVLHDTSDPYNLLLFHIIFNTDPAGDIGQAVADHLEEIFSAFVEMEYEVTPNIATGPSTAQREPTSNFRYYCDNDRLDGTSRWQLRLDPPPADQPGNYISQARRPRWPRSRHGQYQEWWDPTNNVIMGESIGCQSNALGQTYDPTPVRASLPGYPRSMIWATVTICDIGLDRNRLISIGDLPRNGDLEMIPNVLFDLATITSSTILREFFRFPPWKLQDFVPIGYQGVGKEAIFWEDVIHIDSPFDASNNANSLMYFAILARLKERGWRLSSTDEDSIRSGRLYH